MPTTAAVWTTMSHPCACDCHCPGTLTSPCTTAGSSPARRSTPRTSLPSARKRSTSARPMNPVAPVTNTFIARRLSAAVLALVLEPLFARLPALLGRPQPLLLALLARIQLRDAGRPQPRRDRDDHDRHDRGGDQQRADQLACLRRAHRYPTTCSAAAVS